MATPVPKDDLPSNIVPGNDLPESAKQSAPASLIQNMFEGAKTGFKYGSIPGATLGMTDALVKHMGRTAGTATQEFATSHDAPPEIAGALGAFSDTLVNALPMVGGGGAGAKAAPLVESAAAGLMKRAMGAQRADLISGKAARTVDTMFREGANPTMGGAEKLQALVKNEHDKVTGIIRNSDEVVPADISQGLKRLEDKFRNRPNADQIKNDISAVEKQFNEHKLVNGQPVLPVQIAHDLKGGYQDTIGDKGYGELKNATTEAEKTIARLMRERVAKVEPSAAEALAKESDLINAIKVIQRSKGYLSGNKNLIGLGMLHPSTLPLWLLDRSSAGTGLLARMLHHNAAGIGEAAGAVTGGAYDIANHMRSLSDLQR